MIADIKKRALHRSRILNKLLVENHLRTHVTDMFEAGGDARESAVAELLTVFELTNNRGQ